MSDIALTSRDQDINALLIRAATDPAFDASKFETAVRFLTERETRQAHRAFNDAMARSQATMRMVPKDAKNDYLKSRYATLNGMLGVILPALAENGLSMRFGSAQASQPGWQKVTCIVSLGDHVETTALEGPIVLAGTSASSGRSQMTPIQATGSTTTYLKRYLLGMVFALVLSDEQDDDGEGGRDEPPSTTKSVPLNKGAPPPPRPPATNGPRSYRDVLQSITIALRDAKNADEADRVLCSEDVTRAKETFKDDAKEELDRLISGALQKWFSKPSAEELPDVAIVGEDKLAG